MNNIGSTIARVVGGFLAFGLLFAMSCSASTLVWGVPPAWGLVALFVLSLGLLAGFGRLAGWLPNAEATPRHVVPLLWLWLATVIVLVAVAQFWNARIGRLEAALKAEGLPASLAEYAEDVPAARNGAAALEAWTAPFTRTRAGAPRAFNPVTALSKVLDDVDGDWQAEAPGDTTGAWGPAAAAAFTAIERRYARYMGGVDRDLTAILARYPRRVAVDYHVVAKDPMGQDALRGLGAFVSAERGYRVLAEHRAMQGDMAGAWKAVRSQLQLNRLILQDHTLIGRMIVVANSGIIARTATTIMQNRRDTVLPPDLAKGLAAIIAEPWVAGGFAGEIAWGLDVRRHSRSKWLGGSLLGNRRLGYLVERKMTFLGFADAAQYHQITQVLEPAARVRGWTPDLRGGELDRYAVSRGWAAAWVPWIDLPRYLQLLQKEYEAKTRVQFALVVSALHQYRAKTGKYPPGLALLAPRYLDAATLADVFSGRELGYQPGAKGAGYELSSVGPLGNRSDSRARILAVKEPLGVKTPVTKP